MKYDPFKGGINVRRPGLRQPELKRAKSCEPVMFAEQLQFFFLGGPFVSFSLHSNVSQSSRKDESGREEGAFIARPVETMEFTIARRCRIRLRKRD